MSELTILGAVALGLGIPLVRSLATTLADRRRSPAERFASACRELGLTPVDGAAVGEALHRGRALGVEVEADRIEPGDRGRVTARIAPPIGLGLALVSDGELPPLAPDEVAEDVLLVGRGAFRARATDATRARALSERLARRIGRDGERYHVSVDDETIRLETRGAFVRDDLGRMAAVAAGVFVELDDRKVTRNEEESPSARWSRFAEKRGLDIEVGPTLSGVLSQVRFEAALDHDPATNVFSADLVLRGDVAEGRVFSLVAREREPRASGPDAGGSTGDAAIDRRFCLLVANARGRASLDDARVRRVIAGLPASVTSVHLASLGLRLGVARVTDGQDLEELVRQGDALVRAASGRGSEERPVYR